MHAIGRDVQDLYVSFLGSIGGEFAPFPPLSGTWTRRAHRRLNDSESVEETEETVAWPTRNDKYPTI